MSNDKMYTWETIQPGQIVKGDYIRTVETEGAVYREGNVNSYHNNVSDWMNETFDWFGVDVEGVTIQRRIETPSNTITISLSDLPEVTTTGRYGARANCGNFDVWEGTTAETLMEAARQNIALAEWLKNHTAEHAESQDLIDRRNELALDACEKEYADAPESVVYLIDKLIEAEGIK